MPDKDSLHVKRGSPGKKPKVKSKKSGSLRKNARILGVQERKKRTKNINTRRTKVSIIERDVRRKGVTKKNKRLGK